MLHSPTSKPRPRNLIWDTETMQKPSVVYDACVLYPAPLRDALVSLALTGLFRAHWTQAIHDEWIRNLLAHRSDLTPQQVNRTCHLMNKAVPDSLVTGYEAKIRSLSLPDPDDRHVLAAALHSKSQRIITFNLKDFPPRILSGYGIEACHPDTFIAQLLEENPEIVATALEAQRLRLIRPPQSAEEFLATLLRQSLPRTTEMLRPLLATG